MCLTVNMTRTTRLRRGNPNDKIKIYKMLRFENNRIVTPYKYAPFEGGVFYAGGSLTSNIKENSTIYGGAIHAYRLKIRPTSWKFRVEGYGLRKDLVAVGQGNDICFRKIFVPKKVLRKACSDFKRKVGLLPKLKKKGVTAKSGK